MSRLKIYRICLTVWLIVSVLLMLVYGRWYLNTQIPDVIRVSMGEEQTLNLGLKEVSVLAVEKQRVIPGGIPIGIYLETEGVYVVGTAEVEAMDGLSYEPAYQVVQAGDYILAVNGKRIHDKDELIACIQANRTDIMIVKLLRNDQTIQVRLNAVQTREEDYKVGVWVKDDIQGIGTLTYITEDMGFGALGHGITDTDTGELLETSGGSLYDTEILEIIKGERGTPGEISGMITYSERHVLGTIDQNTSAGIFGHANQKLRGQITGEPVDVAFKQEIRTGTAYIQSAVSGEIKNYQIQIQEIRLNEDDVNKGMIFQVTDPELLSETGGVIQGMSGSPILQDGKLAGAVTHVFVNDPTKGYAIFAETMVNAGKPPF
ncbi:MAG TPA: SpoIVB peptidase [Lachnospiraceae bacterium]|nr:SpoIVB peptidase [Lachnospiraceae bacterium]